MPSELPSRVLASRARDLGYRRFFDVGSLVGTSIENPRVFSATHAPDPPARRARQRAGPARRPHRRLARALDYLTRLRSLAKNAWIVVEKILEPGETLREDWPIDGTTGYDFLNQLNGLFVKPSALPELGAFYAEFSGQSREFPELARGRSGKCWVNCWVAT